MLKEIGSHFWINPNDKYEVNSIINPHIFNINYSDFSWLSTGRSGIRLALKNILNNNIKSNVALVPAYTCESVIEPFLKEGFVVLYYCIDNNFNIDKDYLYNLVKDNNVSVLLVNRYFGFDTLKDCNKLFFDIHNLGTYIIEDRTQCLYSDIEPIDADYWIGSIRKWCGVPDGGFIASKYGEIIGKPLDSDVELEKIKVNASYMKYNYLFNNIGIKKDFLDKYREAENLLDSRDDIFMMSKTSYEIQSCLDIETLKNTRRNNYNILLNGFKNFKYIDIVFPILNDGIVPLYFPIRVNDRDKVQKILNLESIYVPIIWPRYDKLPKLCDSVEELYKELLCIPIDQRYSEDDMLRIVSCLKNNIE